MSLSEIKHDRDSSWKDVVKRSLVITEGGLSELLLEGRYISYYQV